MKPSDTYWMAAALVMLIALLVTIKLELATSPYVSLLLVMPFVTALYFGAKYMSIWYFLAIGVAILIVMAIAPEFVIFQEGQSYVALTPPISLLVLILGIVKSVRFHKRAKV